MNLKVVIENNTYSINIPEDVTGEGHSFFEKMDADMNQGWQMDRQWINAPTIKQRCQIAASRIADAINTENETLACLMAGYILNTMPSVTEVQVDTNGEMSETEFIEG
ncbi:hypothetical protein JYT26_01855 [Beggiatoa alba]|nr:hypothetical protein [Beggiatoa alba]